MKSIYKYPIIPTGRGTVRLELPYQARPLSVQYQEGTGMCLWALVDPAAVKVERFVYIYGTGWDAPRVDTLDYLATLQDSGGFVWHVFISREVAHV